MNPPVWLSKFRTVTGFQLSGPSGKYFVIESSSPIFPSSTSIMTAVAVNCLPIDPDWKIVSGFTDHTMFEVGEAKTLRPHNFSVPRYQKREAGNVLPVHLAF